MISFFYLRLYFILFFSFCCLIIEENTTFIHYLCYTTHSSYILYGFTDSRSVLGLPTLRCMEVVLPLSVPSYLLLFVLSCPSFLVYTTCIVDSQFQYEFYKLCKTLHTKNSVSFLPLFK